ncbi:MAG: 1-acyl-sn-glycerol-3-phosphate acyltransferase [Pseudomonadales bacterium]|nr:1-acyl-sn-glycerol-3-phosphate acyltransferase [Pseudomonadales bacterium]NIX08687.1 1-acyl-sn-glycerol-3-phosphate acyltransferase [Pseudomonadales bacterium]
MISGIRSLSFFAGYAVITIIWGALSLLVAWLMPYRMRFLFIVGAWTRMILAWLRLTCGIRCRVEGRENIPEQPCIVLARHESTWETLFLQSLFSPQATLIKRELLWIPFFGWAFALLRPIAIDRSEPRKALRRLINQGRARLNSGTWVVMFPEGTRMPPGQPGKFQAGGAALAAATEAPVVVVAHNAGSFWPAHEFRKQPGTITLRIAQAIETAGKSTKQINDEAALVMAELAPPSAQQR